MWALSVNRKAPIKVIVEADPHRRTEKQVRGMVNRARDHGLLSRTTTDGTRGPTGRAGGELLERGRVLLTELGVEAGSDYVVPEERK